MTQTQSAATPLPKTIVGYIWQTTRRDQLLLSLLAVMVFALNTVPLELQRRIVNDAIKNGNLRTILLLSLAYAGVALAEGAIKLLLNIYSASVSERASLRLRKAIFGLLASLPTDSQAENRQGVEISMIIQESDAIGGFVGISVSQPLLQGGILLSVFGYMLYLQPFMALLSFLLLLPQFAFIPMLQGAINRRTKARIETLREVSSSIVANHAPGSAGLDEQHHRIDSVYTLNMGIFKLKFSMNFLMNLLHHMGVAVVFAVGGWYAVQGRIEVGTIVAFISGLAKANDPWGETVNWYREMMVVAVKYRLIADTVKALAAGGGISPTGTAMPTS
jgi:ABC-type multidrug transport system fused ATPase/permease subunit